uniref:Uncharacterized protein n=1 Tax=Anguilla anguilla TaxID=7936 RepID=A0A0E9QDF3_ANGAN
MSQTQRSARNSQSLQVGQNKFFFFFFFFSTGESCLDPTATPLFWAYLMYLNQ